MTRKILYILRHAKAETGGPGQEDHDRQLVKRGQEAARAMGEYMAVHGLRPDKVLCSAAVRAKETWAGIQKAYRQPPTVEYSDKLYLASGNETIPLVAQTPEEVRSLLIIGHNPGFHQLALKLAKSGEEDLIDALMLKFPTCALATVAFEGAWKEIGKAKGVLAGFVTPKEVISGQ